MYAKFFGLSQDPFSIAPDPRYLFMSERHREALAHLLYGLKSGGGFVLLSGEIGTGKTTVCRCFLEQIPSDCNVAYIFNPKLTARELLRSICDEFHIALAQDADTAKDFIDPLNEYLLRAHAAGRNNVLVIDEAQNLSADVLEQLRLLTNLETNERKLLQIVLIGQPELRQMLAGPELEQLAQRVIARFHLDALSWQETKHYIAHRMAVAGMSGTLPFQQKALARIHKITRGIPRRINLLCDRALLGSYANGSLQVGKATVDKAAIEVFGTNMANQGRHVRPRRSTWRWNGPVTVLTLASLSGLLVGAAQVFNAPKADTLAVTSHLVAPPVASPPVAEPVVTLTSTAGLSRSEFNASVVSNPRTQNQAWQELALAWGLTLEAEEACSAALKKRVYCFNSKQISLGLVRELNRPGIVTLLGDNKRLTYAVLTALTGKTATRRMGTQTIVVTLPVLAEIWMGDFSTLWRAPENHFEKTATGQAWPGGNWLTTELAKVPDTGDATAAVTPGTKQLPESAVRSQVYAFQLAHGLVPDGKVGPMTLMQLNRATGVDEPRLKTDQP